MRSFRRFFVAACVVISACSGFAPAVRADEPAKPTTTKSEQIKVSDAAKPIVDKIRDAYAKAPGLQMTGTYTLDWDYDNDQQKLSAEFTSSYKAPNKFRHETKDELLFGSTGEQLYSLIKNKYRIVEAPKTRGAVGDLPEKFRDLLQDKNPSLLIAMTDQPVPHLADGATTIDKSDDVVIDGKPFSALKVGTKFAAEAEVLIDPATGFMRRLTLDASKALEQRGRQNVKKALLIVDYTATKPEAPADKGAFVWSPPEGSRDVTSDPDEKEKPAYALIGKPAPDFELEGLDGQKVKLKDLKGQVVVLDFWATWCGPCIVAMPVLDKVVESRKDKIKAFAVNCEEDKATVEAFAKEAKFSLKVLLDTSGETGRKYNADQGIPETVIIDKEGVVRKVFVGEAKPEEYAKAIDEELSKVIREFLV